MHANKIPDFYCYMTGAVCGALAFFCHLNNLLKQLNIENDTSPLKIEELESVTAFELLNSNIQRAFLALDLDLLKQQIDATIKGISSCIEHWKSPPSQPSIYFFIRNWLSGKKPPPRCLARVVNGDYDGQCFEEANAKTSTYCDILHSCKAAASSGLCVNERISQATSFCSEHSCMFPIMEGKKEKSRCKSER